MKRYRRKMAIIKAGQVGKENWETLRKWCNGIIVKSDGKNCFIIIETLEGNMTANIGDWILKGIDGEFYPVKPYIFERLYEEI